MLQKIATAKPIYFLAPIVLIVALLAGFFYFGMGGAPQTVANGDTVLVYYTGTLTNGTVFDSNVGGQPINFTIGANEVIPGFEQGIIGMKLNESKTITVPANEAYGEPNPELIVPLPLSQFGNQTVKVGEAIREVVSNRTFEGLVTAVNATTATVDFNSPLAGQTLIFNVRVVGISKK
jgi:FKBP-type peptidyl-prolyl cis-trans isomerase 2